jgi:D-alanyl-D-alanine endopeptidase (penicillin-binding protein 7)
VHERKIFTRLSAAVTGVIAAAALAVTGAVAAQSASTATKPSPSPVPTTTSAAVKAPVKPAVSATAQKSPVPSPSPAPQTRTSLAQARAAAAERAQRAAQARVKAAELERQRLERDAMTPHYKRDLLGNQVPDVRAAAAIVFDPQTNSVLWEQNSHEQRSVASLTKLMTTLTFIADEPDLEQVVAVTPIDMRNASTTYIRAGDRISYRDLLHLALIASDNAAARVLARTSEGGTVGFVKRMNEMAASLGLTSSVYVDPSGLDPGNMSSAYDTSHLIAFASGDPVLGPIVRTQDYTAQTKFRPITIHSTNRLLGDSLLASGMDVVGGKTGFIAKAGYCLATLLRMPQGPQIAVVVLGANNSTMRFWEARHLFNWVVGRSTGLIGGIEEIQ